jgi:hypothetical protein
MGGVMRSLPGALPRRFPTRQARTTGPVATGKAIAGAALLGCGLKEL